jgi:hypothetical protein
MVANGMFGLTEMKDQLKCKTAVSMVMAGGSHRIDDHKSIFIIMPSYLFSNIHSHKGVVAAKMRDHFCGSSPDFKSFIGLI